MSMASEIALTPPPRLISPCLTRVTGPILQPQLLQGEGPLSSQYLRGRGCPPPLVLGGGVARGRGQTLHADRPPRHAHHLCTWYTRLVTLE